MITKLSILIADDDHIFCEILKNRINSEEDLEVVGIAGNGLEAIEMILRLKPSVVLLDIVMPKLDGIGVMEKLSEVNDNQKPLVIILSAIKQDTFIQKAMSLGAEYYIIKPLDTEMLLLRIRELSKANLYFRANKYRLMKKIYFDEINGDVISREKENEFYHDYLETEVTEFILKTGISPHLSGYKYLREAIIQSMLATDTYGALTNVLYQSVAKKFSSTAKRVEHAIRNAIRSAWQRRG